MKKITSLTEFASSPVHELGRTFLSTCPAFNSGKKNRRLPNSIWNRIKLSAIEDLKVIKNTISGESDQYRFWCLYVVIYGRHCFHIDSKFWCDQQEHACKENFNLTLRSRQGEKGSRSERKSRITLAEDNGKYTTISLKANRGSTGVAEFWPKKLGVIWKGRK